MWATCSSFCVISNFVMSNARLLAPIVANQLPIAVVAEPKQTSTLKAQLLTLNPQIK